MNLSATVSGLGPAAQGRWRGFWNRRIVSPIREQLTRGITPRRVSTTLAVGSVCSVFPFLGLTALLNLVIGHCLRLNHPILQTLNQLLGPLQLVLILAYVRIGEVIWRAEPFRFSISEMVVVFREESIGGFLEQFGLAGIHALTAWIVTAPIIFGLVYLLALPFMRRWSAVANREDIEQ